MQVFLLAIVTHYCFFIGDVKWTTILKAIYTVTKYLLTSLHIRPCSPVCFVKSFLPSILDAISLASSGLLKKLHLLDEYIVWWHLSEEHWAKKTRPRIKTTKYSVFNNFQNLREHNPYTTLEPSFECSFSTPTSQNLCLDYQIRVTFNTWKQTLAHFHIQAAVFGK